MYSTLLIRRLPRKSSRCFTGGPSPSPEDCDGAVPDQRANFDSRANRNRSPTSTSRVAAAIDRRRALVAQCGAVLIQQSVDVAFELADLTARDAVLLDEGDQP